MAQISTSEDAQRGLAASVALWLRRWSPDVSTNVATAAPVNRNSVKVNNICCVGTEMLLILWVNALANET